MSHDQDIDPQQARALRQLAKELSAAPPPELDWRRLETEIRQRTALEAAARRRRRPPSAWGSLAAFAAAAAAVVMLIASASSQERPGAGPAPFAEVVDVRSLPTLPQEADTLPRYSVEALPPNAVIQSEAEPIQLTLEGVATWTLGPRSRAIVRTRQAPHVVELEQGSLVAEVVSRHSADELVESFVVETGGTRVAVHGTVFSVVRTSELVHVEVTRGTVTVGPASYRGATTGHLLVSPARASFNAHNGAFVRRLPPTSDAVAAHEPTLAEHEPVDRGNPEPASPARAAADPLRPPSPRVGPPAASGSAPKATTSSEPTAPADPPAPAEPPLLTVPQARAAMVGCLSGHAKRGEGEAVVTITSQVTAVLGADGSVNAVRFSPPLQPDLQARCGASLFGRKIDAAGSVSFRVTFTAK